MTPSHVRYQTALRPEVVTSVLRDFVLPVNLEISGTAGGENWPSIRLDIARAIC